MGGLKLTQAPGRRSPLGRGWRICATAPAAPAAPARASLGPTAGAPHPPPRARAGAGGLAGAAAGARPGAHGASQGEARARAGRGGGPGLSLHVRALRRRHHERRSQGARHAGCPGGAAGGRRRETRARRRLRQVEKKSEASHPWSGDPPENPPSSEAREPPGGRSRLHLPPPAAAALKGGYDRGARTIPEIVRPVANAARRARSPASARAGEDDGVARDGNDGREPAHAGGVSGGVSVPTFVEPPPKSATMLDLVKRLRVKDKHGVFAEPVADRQRRVFAVVGPMDFERSWRTSSSASTRRGICSCPISSRFT